MKKTLKICVYVIAGIALAAFLFFFVRGIYFSCFGDDIITAQDRVNSSYQFLYMILCGIGMLIAVIVASYIKIDKIDKVEEQA